jgi:sodium pump decarboxylase gamma subunit
MSMSPFVQGLEVSILGLVITFLALGVFILIMVGLQKLFPGEVEAKETAQVEETPVLEVQTADSSDEGAVIAAIAAAVAYTRAAGRANLGETLQQQRGGWWTARRLEARIGDVKRR